VTFIITLRGDTHKGKLTGKVAVVTGASKGIGAAIAKALAAEGASVVVNYASSKSGADAVVAAITKAGGQAVAVGEAAIKNFGRLDILVNNSGVFELSPIESITEEQFHRIFNINVLGAILTTQAAVKYLGEGASIINISSGVSSVTPPNFSVYTGTKSAVDAITRTLAKELGPRGIRVNAINPGLVITEGVTTAGFDQSDFRKTLESQTPLGRIGQTEDIAPAAVFFASSDSKWITGETLLIAGGLR